MLDFFRNVLKKLKAYGQIKRGLNLLLFACFFSTSGLFLMTQLVAEENLSQIGWREELRQIDAELKRLDEDQTKQKLAKARWTDKGMQWQFQQDMKQEAKRAFQKADAAEEQIKINQQQIDLLEARKQKIIEKHPESYE